MTKTYIVAGTRAEFDDWMRSKGHDPRDRNFVYVDGLHCFRGVSDPHGFYVGSYEKRADINDISAMIKQCQYKPSTSSAKYNMGIIVQEFDKVLEEEDDYNTMLKQVEGMLSKTEQIKNQYKYPVDEDDAEFWNKIIT